MDVDWSNDQLDPAAKHSVNDQTLAAGGGRGDRYLAGQHDRSLNGASRRGGPRI